MPFAKTTTSALALAALSATAAAARDNVQIAGSSTVLPYASIVAEAFGENTDFPTPVVESGGSSAGLKRFCEGVGANTIDIANASRAIRASEIEACAANGVDEIIEVRIGYDGIVFASDINGNSFAFTPEDWYLAMAAEIPVDGAMVTNENVNWSTIRDGFPNQPITAYIPGTKHGTREVFEEKVLLAGCEASGAYDAIVAILGDEMTRQKMPAWRCAPMAPRSTSTATTPKRWPASNRTPKASASSVWRSTRTTPTSCRSPRCRA
jgi:phosphate transport system substrate-binding protein